MGHPDQHTPDNHNVTNRDDAPAQNLSKDTAADLHDDRLEKDADTGSEVRTPDPEDKRQGEAGNTYTGRQMSDALKDNPRIDDADRVEKDAE
ncbi:MAG: hypothetical protein ABJF88_10845 [Rhodothermales bacterium]